MRLSRFNDILLVVRLSAQDHDAARALHPLVVSYLGATLASASTPLTMTLARACAPWGRGWRDHDARGEWHEDEGRASTTCARLQREVEGWELAA
jgi:hypothetical protein